MTDTTTAAVITTAAADITMRIAADQPSTQVHRTGAAEAMAETPDMRPTAVIITAAAIASTKRQPVRSEFPTVTCLTMARKEAAGRNVVMSR